MRRREFIVLAPSIALLRPAAIRAQQSSKLYHIGYFSAGERRPTPQLEEAFVGALRGLGWIEGTNVVFEYRYADNHLDRLPELAAQLVALKVDVIVAAGTLAPLAVKRLSTTIPIVLTSAGDPLGSGLVSSLAHPGGNITGLSLMASDLGGKRLELLRELLPSISKVAVLWNAANPYAAKVFTETERAARTLRIALQSVEVRKPDDFDTAFDSVKIEHPDGLISIEDPLTFDHRKEIVEFAAKNNLPAVHGLREFAEIGGLIAYGANIPDLSRRAATYVDKILRGAKPADLPVEQPTKFEFLINLRAAKALNISISPELLARADEVIE
ncbi:putative ABC transport system substrate-binding protein [Bradyrhizobium erythrophlei]|nr:putative ABC transport system substrate-binding protein [Bradyrhizobium erythrophlei]